MDVWIARARALVADIALLAFFAAACQAQAPTLQPAAPASDVAALATPAVVVDATESVPTASTALTERIVAPTIDATILPTTAALASEAKDVDGFKLATCEMLGADGGLEFATQFYVGAATSMLKGEPVAGKTFTLTSAQRAIVLKSLHGLKDAGGKFCGVVDDAGGWDE